MGSFKDNIEFLISRLRISAPDLDTSPTSNIRMILDAVAELNAQASLAEEEVFDWDIDKLSGKDLDDFVGNFGFSRMPATHATGFVTLTFAANTTRDYLLPQGTRLVAYRPGRRQVNYLLSTDVAIPRYSSFATLPVVAELPGPGSNARPGEITYIDYAIDGFVQVRNEEAISGGRGAESDEELKARFRANLFRNILGSEDYYRSVALRHPRVAQVQLIKPQMQAEEHLKVVDGVAECQEDTVKYTYPSGITVYSPSRDLFLEESRDYNVQIDNDTPAPPVIRFLPGAVEEGEDIVVRYSYCSRKSRNDPASGTLHYLDLYVSGRQPTPVMDFATFPPDNVYGNGVINQEAHPGGVEGAPYYIFTRQPVMRLHKEFDVLGRRYYEGRDYVLIKDRSHNEGSSRARDALLWLSSLPPTGREPDGFYIPYYVEGVVEDIQEALDDPEIRAATDDVLCHSAEEVIFDISLTIEWERGFADENAVREAIQRYFAETPMGSKIRIGGLVRSVAVLSSVAAVFVEEISSETKILGRNSWRYDVPLPDGSVPVLGELNITNTAPNIYERG